ncbi:MAG: zinc-finger domain-containing protein [Tepidimonas sp.]|uniref:zinc-finger domain-containing protein n=1 Tax=Tepidimonas sp. TaxID=2002775 RepID=UPI00259D99F5|nr:zinc-finger domain-containing protein [Tepidimonas sp.]MDM7456994.1 zinc-finger domain-containing protein [Tepidimonas sp.]
MSSPTSSPAVVELSSRDLNAHGGVICPSPQAGMQIWNSHPRVFLDVAKTGEARCPYCGTVYRLRAGQRPVHHG